jgi:Putative lumazine-binding
MGLIALTLVSCSPKLQAHPDEAAIRAFLNRYFETWSKRDMEGYGACFAPEARILFIARSGEIVSEGTVDFLHGQKLAHERSSFPMTERPLEMKIQGDMKVAQAVVTWVLNKGAKEERGTDFFTLRRDGAGWRVVSLVFYGE